MALGEEPTDGRQVAGGEGVDRRPRPGRSRSRRARRAGTRPGRAGRGPPPGPRASRRAGSGWPGRCARRTATAVSHWLRRRLYAEPSRWRGEPVWQTTRTTSGGRGIGRQACDRQSSSSAAPATPQDVGELVHQAALDADEAVLRALADLGEAERVDPGADVVEHRPCRGQLDRGRRRQAGVGRQGGGDHAAQTGQRQAGLGKRPGRADDVVQPPAGRGGASSRSNPSRSPSSRRVSWTRRSAVGT